jgi:hypothetical protein
MRIDKHAVRHLQTSTASSTTGEDADEGGSPRFPGTADGRLRIRMNVGRTRHGAADGRARSDGTNVRPMRGRMQDVQTGPPPRPPLRDDGNRPRSITTVVGGPG